MATTFSQRITDTTNDVFLGIEQSTIDNNGDAELIMGEHPGTTTNVHYVGGFRFTSVTIPKGSVITSAKLTFTVAGASAGTPTYKTDGEAADSAAAWSTFADANGRSRTTASAIWTAPASPATNSTFDSGDISSVIQEIVNRAGWASGNSLVLFNSSSNMATFDNQWTLTYDLSTPGGAGKSALLTITWDTLNTNFFF